MRPIAYASKTYATIAADVDLRTDMPGITAGAIARRPAIAVRVGTVGDLHVAYECGVEDTFQGLAVGEIVYGRFIKLMASGTSAAKVTAFWGES
jgi:hypothetical protein